MSVNINFLWCGLAFYLFPFAFASSAGFSFDTDVIGVQESYLSASYWVNKVNNTEQLMSASAIKAFNQQLIENNTFITDPLSTPEFLSKKTLTTLITSISKKPNSTRVFKNGQLVTNKDYQRYITNLNKQNILENNKVSYGLVVKRSSLRTFPTADKVYKQGQDYDLDRFQETALFPADVVAILHQSKDKNWFLVQSYNYVAWLPVKAVAIGTKAIIKQYKSSQNYIIVTGNKVFTNFVPDKVEISQLQLDMGVKLPLAKPSEYGNQVYGQNPYASYVVKLPNRNKYGKLKFSLALIARNQDVHTNYLPLTYKNIIKQAFKFLGERYGWGHDYNGRDCTGFIGEIYKSFGLIMPRNTSQQGKSPYGYNQFFSKQATKAKKQLALQKLAVGDLIYIPGHVMMFLGYEQGKPYVIHDVKGLGYLNTKGQFYQGTLNGVSVTPLLPLRISKQTSYVDLIYNIKRIATVKGLL